MAQIGQDEVAGIRNASGELPYMALDIAVMQAMNMHESILPIAILPILPEHLPGCLGLLKRSVPWGRNRPGSSRWAPAPSSSWGCLVNTRSIVIWIRCPAYSSISSSTISTGRAAPYAQNLACYLGRLSRFRQHEPGWQIEAKPLMGVRHRYVIDHVETWSVRQRSLAVKAVTPKQDECGVSGMEFQT